MLLQCDLECESKQGWVVVCGGVVAFLSKSAVLLTCFIVSRLYFSRCIYYLVVAAGLAAHRPAVLLALFPVV